MAMLNITGTKEVVDPSYRYKMPRLVARIEGRGNGIRVCVVNMSDIATALNRPPDIVTKYFGVELGAQSRWEADADKCTVNGSFATPDLQKLLNTFIDKFVLCPKCQLPETALSVSVRKGLIYHKCAACGAKELADMTHKLTTFILKQAEVVAAASEASAKGDAKKAKGKSAATAAAAGGGGDGEGGVKKVKVKKVKAAAAASAEEEEGGEGAAAAAAAAGEDEDDDDGAAATHSALGAEVRAALAREAATTKSTPGGTNTKAAAASPSTSALQAALSALLATPKDAGCKAAAIAAARGASASVILTTLTTAATSGGGGGVDAAVATAALRNVPLALEALYDGDALPEASILTWFKGVEGDATVKARAKPFIEWLEAADEEDEE